MTEQEREDKLHAWFDMWLRQTDDGILELFVPDAVYVESWGPEYHGVDAIRHWFMEWNTHQAVLPQREPDRGGVVFQKRHERRPGGGI